MNAEADMKLYFVGFGIMGLCMMGCSLIQPAASPAGSATITSAQMNEKDDGLLPRRHASTPADPTDPWDGTKVAGPSWKSDHGDPWAAPGTLETLVAAPPATPTP
jgi:hypothetical protein